MADYSTSIRVYQRGARYHFLVVDGKKVSIYRTNVISCGLEQQAPKTGIWYMHEKRFGHDGNVRNWPLRKEMAARLLAHLIGIDSFRFVDGDKEFSAFAAGKPKRFATALVSHILGDAGPGTLKVAA